MSKPDAQPQETAQRSRQWDRLTAALGTITIAGVLIIAATPVVNIAGRAYSVEPDLKPAGAIVVLGSGILKDGSLTYESQQRLLLGMRLYKEGLAPILVLSGPPKTGNSTAPESTVRARIAVELGIPESKIFELKEVRTTRDEAQQTARLLAPFVARHVLLVTESMHMRRAKAVFEAAGFVVSPAPSDNFAAIAQSPIQRLILFENLLMHSAGLAYYRLAGYI